jgi:hypothetical protein
MSMAYDSDGALAAHVDHVETLQRVAVLGERFEHDVWPLRLHHIE